LTIQSGNTQQSNFSYFASLKTCTNLSTSRLTQHKYTIWIVSVQLIIDILDSINTGTLELYLIQLTSVHSSYIWFN